VAGLLKVTSDRHRGYDGLALLNSTAG